MSSSIGSPLSSKKLSTAINATGRRISTNTVETYMQALTSAFIFYHTERFDIKAEKNMKTLGKYYIADMGFRNVLLESFPSCAGSLDGQLENLVCLELLRRGFQVYTGKHGSDEISFVAFQTAANGAITETSRESESPAPAYFQVTASVRDPAVLAGKLSPLDRIRDNHPKYILSLDETPFRSNYNGIVLKNLVDWLLEQPANGAAFRN
jgi:predicted AAA+ superfamily ATPase